MLALALALALHAGGLGWVYSLEQPERTLPVPKRVDQYAKLKALRETVELPKPEPPPPPPPKEEPKPPPEPPPEVAKPEPPKEIKPPQDKRRARAKPAKEPPPQPAAKPPAPLALENVNLSGGVNVQRGESDTFGDPSIAATHANTQPQAATPDLPVGKEDIAAVPAAPPKRVAPRIKTRVAGEYPADAPKLGRDVEVRLSLYIDEEGRVSKAKVVVGAGAVFDDEARKLVRRLRFHPGTVGGTPEPMWVPWVVVFEPE